MSLYIGNLSTRTRRDELERVFRRFGQCDVRLKDGYGFVVYGFAPQAEKALKVLQGRNICGQQLTLTWSNKQPRPFQKSARGARSYESRARDFASRKVPSDYGDFRSGIREPDSAALDEGRDYHQEAMVDNDFIEEERLNFREDLPRDGGDVVPEIVDNGRWGEQVDNLSTDNGLDDKTMFDRYEPYHGYERKDKDEYRWIESSGGSALGSSQDNIKREGDGDAVVDLPNDSRFQQTCYSCGALGHKQRDCPKKNSSRRNFTRFNRRQDDMPNKSRGGDELERFRSKSWGRMQARRGNRASHSRKLRMTVKNRNSPEIDRVQRNEHVGKKRRKRETESPERYTGKKSRRSASESFHSEYTTSGFRSASKSSNSRERATSRSKSRSVARDRSLSLTSRSSSKSRYRKPVDPKARSRSRSWSRSSSPTSLSLSVSLGRLTSSPSKAQLNRKQSLDDKTTPESKDIQVQQAGLKDTDAYSENPEFATEMANGNAISASKVEDDKGQSKYNAMAMPSSKVNLLQDAGAFTAGPSSPMLTGYPVKPSANPGLETSLNTCSDISSISPEEMCTALKQYGLNLREESEEGTSLEAYFGSARLWPWEAIYYRRVKKGPISVENYSRRVAQNKKFGIYDKYIRSSSGWGEINKENP